MNNYNTIQELEIDEKQSVFSFSFEIKHQKNQNSPNPSFTTNSNSNTIENQSSLKISESNNGSDEVLSMVDFFIDAWDYNSQIDLNSPLVSNSIQLNNDRCCQLEDKCTIGTGIDLMKLKKARNLINLKFKKIHKKSFQTAPMLFKYPTGIRSKYNRLKDMFNICKSRKTLGKFHVDKFN